VEVIDTINLEPTPEGYKRIAEVFRRSILQYEAESLEVEKLIEQGIADSSFSTEVVLTIEEALACLLDAKETALGELRKAVADIDTYLASLETVPFDVD